MTVIYIPERLAIIHRQRCATCANIRGEITTIQIKKLNRYGEQFSIFQYKTNLRCLAPTVENNLSEFPHAPSGQIVDKTDSCLAWVSVRKSSKSSLPSE